MPVPSQGYYGFDSFPVVDWFVCLYTYEFWLSLCKIVRSSVILLLPLLIVIILEGFSIFWLWSYLKVVQSFDCDHTWRLFNLLIEIILEGCSIFWLWSYLKVFQSFNCDHTWRFYNLLIVIILEGFQSFDCDHTWRFSHLVIVIILEGCSIFWLWSYMKVFQSFDCDHTWRVSNWRWFDNCFTCFVQVLL